MTLTPAEMMLVAFIFVLGVIAIILWMRSRRRKTLKAKFGPEYARAVHEAGNEQKAEQILAERQRRVSKYNIKPLPSEMRNHFVETWRSVQGQFVDDPKYAVTRADDLLGEIMLARGYPVHDFGLRADDLSVDHPHVVEHYRVAHDIADKHSQGEASTEDLRTAMIHFRALFDDLVNEPEPQLERSAEREKHHG